MIPIIHRVNNPEELINIPQNCGVEVDIRFSESKLVLGHDLLEEKFDFHTVFKCIRSQLACRQYKRIRH